MSGESVLIVEDDSDSVHIYTLYLQHHGLETLTARTGDEGIRIAREERPDIILMDISIPGLDGWAATRKLKEDPETREIPVIAITAHAFPEDEERSREVGCEEFLTKPCEPKVMLEAIRRILDS